MSQLKISNGKKFTARTGLGRLRQHLNCAEILLDHWMTIDGFA
jgi:hypothetical protein